MNDTPEKKTSFASDISPFFAQYLPNMIWRFDLTSYDDVKANAEQVYRRISKQGMPPPPFSPLSREFIDNFKRWMEQGYPP